MEFGNTPPRDTKEHPDTETAGATVLISGQPSATDQATGGLPSLLGLPSMFAQPAYLADAYWLEQVPVAFWLVEALQPDCIVELGTRQGGSYFGFCQAAAGLRRPARCYAIGPWTDGGEDGADEALFRQVRDHNMRHHAGMSQIIRATAEDAAGYFPDGAIDILHVDGLQEPATVGQLVGQWLPKLSPRAVLVLHGTRDLGVAACLARLRGTYPVFELPQGHGLALIGAGPDQAPLLQDLFALEQDPRGLQVMVDLFAQLGAICTISRGKWLAEHSLAGLREAADRMQQDMQTTQLELGQARMAAAVEQASAAQKQQALEALQKQLAEATAANTALQATATQKQQALEDRVAPLELSLAQMAAARDDAENRLGAALDALESRDAEMKGLRDALSEIRSQLAQRSLEAEQGAQDNRRLKAELDAEQQSLAAVLAERADQARRVAALEQAAQDLAREGLATSETLRRRDTELAKVNELLLASHTSFAEATAAHHETVARHERTEEDLRSALDERTAGHEALYRQIQALEATLQQTGQQKQSLQAGLQSRDADLGRLAAELVTSQRDNNRLWAEQKTLTAANARLAAEQKTLAAKNARLTAEQKTLADTGRKTEQELRATIEDLRQQMGALESHRNDLLASESWRLTAPLRWVVTRLRGGRG